MRIPDKTLSEIVDRLDATEVIGEYVQLKKSGTRYKGLCPFHTEKTPSFTVNSENGLYYCFGCQKGGNLFGFIGEMEGVTFVEAAEILAKRAGVALELAPDTGRAVQRDAYVQLYQKIAGAFHHLLVNSEAAEGARDYLSGRGIGPDTVAKYAVGYAPADRKWLHGFLTKKSYSSDFLDKSGLFTSRSGAPLAFFFDRIMFPILNSRGETIAFGGRALRDDGPKYINSPETDYFKKGENLFGIGKASKAARSSDCFYLVEGYMDVLALSQAGIPNVVAPLGTALTEWQARLLKRYASRGTLLFDSDLAGVKATLRAINLLETTGIVADVVELPSGKDPAEILQREGTEAVSAALEHRVECFHFVLNQGLRLFDVSTPNGKQSIFGFLYPYLSVIDSEVKREGYLRALAEVLHVEYESVRNDFAHKGLARTATKPATGGEDPTTISSDLFLLLAICVNSDHFETARGLISEDDLEDDRARELYIVLEECYRRGDMSAEAILTRLENEPLRALLAQKAASDEFALNQDRLIRESLENIRRRSLEKKRRQIVALLRQSEDAKADQIEVRELLQEKMFLDGELQRMKVKSHV